MQEGKPVLRIDESFFIGEWKCQKCHDGAERPCLVYIYDGGWGYEALCQKHITEAFRAFARGERTED